MPEDSPPQNQEQVLSPENRQRFDAAYKYFNTDSDFWYAAKNRFSENLTGEELSEGKVVFDDLLLGLKYDELRGQSLSTIIPYLDKNNLLGGEKNDQLSKEFERYCVDRLLQDADALVGCIGDNNKDVDLAASEAILLASRLSPDDEAITQLNEKLSSKIAYIGSAFLEDPSTYSCFIDYFLEHPEHTENHSQAREYVGNLLQSDTKQGMDYLTSVISASPSEDGRMTGEQLLADALNEKYNIDGSDLIESWKHIGYSYREKNGPEISSSTLETNLDLISALESERPDITKYLTETCGIHHLARYPKEMLIDQFDTREQHDEKPYLVVIYPYDDHNASFYGDRSRQALKGMHTQAKEFGRNVRIIEARSGREILARLNKQYKDHGKTKIAGGVIGAHGTWYSMRFGPRGAPDSRVSIYDIMQTMDPSDPGHGSSQLIDLGINKFFTEDPSIVLNSCSTGPEYGLAPFLAQRDIHVVAPDADTEIGEISVSEDKGKVMLGATFTRAKAMAYSG